MDSNAKGFVLAFFDLLQARKGVVVVAGVFLLALAVRLLYILTAAYRYTPIYDAGIYDDIARNLITKGCYCVHDHYSSVSRAPLWPWILAIIYYATDKQVIYGQIFYCLLDSITCVLIYLLAKSLFKQEVALVTGLIAALYTGLFIYTGWLYSEALYTFCSTGFVYTLFILQRSYKNVPAESYSSTSWQKKKRFLNGWVILSGLFLAAATLVRPNGSGLFLVLYVWAGAIIVTKVVARQLWIHLFMQVCVISVLAGVLITPWTYRNYIVTHQFVLVATGMGEVLVGAYDDNVLLSPSGAQGFWSPPQGTKIHDEIGYTPTDDQASTKQALLWISSHADKIPTLLWLHFENMWQPYTYSHGLPIEEFPQRLSSKLLFFLITLESLPLFALALLNCIFTWKKYKQDLTIIYLAIAFTILQNVLFYGTMRFRAPMEPFIVLYAGNMLWQLYLLLKRALRLVL